MRNEFERLQQNLPMEQLSMKRYELPKPPPGRMNDIVAWNECVENSYSQLQHQLIRYFIRASFDCLIFFVSIK